jgi:tetratricopeptide (TPR) repeat protein
LNTIALKVPQRPIGREQPKVGPSSTNKDTEQQKKTPQPPTHAKPLPRKKTTLFRQALALHKNGRIQEAKKMYEAALERSPNLASALNNLGTIYISEKDYSEAHRVLEKATLADASYADPYYNLACLHSLQTNVDKGLSYLKKAIAADDALRDQAQRDKDLGNLRGNIEYERILEGM